MPDPRPVLVIGAGPAGLATAAALVGRGARVRLVDRTGQVGGAYARMEPAIQITTPAELIALPGLALGAHDRGDYLSAGAYHRYLVRLAAHHQLAPERAGVVAVAAERGGLVATLDSGERVSARALVVATGMFDHPVRPAIPGLPDDGAATATRPAVTAAPGWRLGRTRAGDRVLVVGAAASGIEIAEGEARAGASVIVSARGRVLVHPQTVLGVDPSRVGFPLLARTPPWLARRFCAGRISPPGVDHGFSALRRAGAIEVRPALARIEGRRACFLDGTTAEVDAIVLATGYRFATPFLPPALVGTPAVRVVGHRCARTAASQYLYGIARDAPAVADELARAHV